MRRLDISDCTVAQALLSADPVAGGLIHGLMLREGLSGGCEFLGLFEGTRLVGILAPDRQGRCPVYADGTEWAPLLAGLLQTRRQTGRPISSVDSPPPLGLALASLVPPCGTDRLAIWFRPAHTDAPAAPAMDTGMPPGLVWRPAAPVDQPELARMYAADPSFAWVNVQRSLAMCQDGHRIWLVGAVGGAIATAGWANTLEPGAGRISGILTAPVWRRRGLGTELVRRLVAQLQMTGRLPYLYVGQDALAAKAAYRKLGFVQHSERILLRYVEGR